MSREVSFAVFKNCLCDFSNKKTLDKQHKGFENLEFFYFSAPFNQKKWKKQKNSDQNIGNQSLQREKKIKFHFPHLYMIIFLIQFLRFF